MEHLIDKSAVITEIDRKLEELYKLLPNASKVENGMITISEACNTGKYTTLESFKDYINTLEVKEMDLEKEMDNYLPTVFSKDMDGGEPRFTTWFNALRKTAIYFSNWQKAKDESTTEDLGEYVNELSKQFPEVSFAKLSRIAVRVAKWQKEQIMVKAIDGIARPDDNEIWCDLTSNNLKDGDKVKVIVI